MRLALLAMLLLWACPAQASEPDWHLVEQTLVAEAANQGYEGMLAVGCVMRNRGWNMRPFAASRRPDLAGWVDKQPKRVREQARAILSQLRAGSADVTNGATHYENVEAFGLPYWAKGKQPVAKVGDHTFWRL